jgi:hypothetical protein
MIYSINLKSTRFFPYIQTWSITEPIGFQKIHVRKIEKGF